MPFDPEFAEKRFGYGLSPTIAPIASAEALLRSVTGPDRGRDMFPIETFTSFRNRLVEEKLARMDIKAVKGTLEEEKERKRLQALRNNGVKARTSWFRQTL